MHWLVCIRSSTVCQDGSILSTDYILYIRSPTGMRPLKPLLFATYVSLISDLISSYGMLFDQYADDTQLYVAAEAKVDTADALKTVSCTHAVQSWFLLNDQHHNPDKSEVMLRWTQVKAYPCEDHADVAGTLLKLRDNVKSLGVTFYHELSFDKHVNLVYQACNYHLWSLRHIRKYLTVDMANTIACSVVGSRFDYYNSILYKTTNAAVTKLQRIQTKTHTRRLSACAPTLAASQLPYRVQDCSHHVQSVKIWLTSLSCWLADPQASSSCYEIQRSMSSSLARSKQSNLIRRFSYAVPSIWNLLPPDLRIKETLPAFKTGLKTYIFLSAYGR